MKRILFHSATIVISLLWLITEYKTCNPISLKGPIFLKFYLILLALFYGSVLILKLVKEPNSKTTFFFMISILVLGFIKLIRGLILGKPVGYLIMILILEMLVILFFRLFQLNNTIK